MRRVRVNWKGAAKVAAIAAGGLLALQALPSLLRAPEPPPLDPDVGLPRIQSQPEVKPPPRPPRPQLPQRHPMPKAKIGSRAKPDRPRKTGEPKPQRVPTPPAPAPAPPPPPAPEPAPAPSPPPTPPPATSDGSVEFAPH